MNVCTRVDGIRSSYSRSLSFAASIAATALWLFVGFELSFAQTEDGSGSVSCDWSSGFHVNNFNSIVTKTAVWDDGDGKKLYAAGYFTTAGREAATSIARWEGDAWGPLSGSEGEGIDLSGFSDRINTLVGFQDELYVGGKFTSAGGLDVANIARWDGANWSSLPGSGLDGEVRAMTIFQDGESPSLYVVGDFVRANGLLVHGAARWDGVSWSPLIDANGVNGFVEIDTYEIHDLFSWDDGSGEKLYIAGRFDLPTTSNVENVLRWDGISWTALSVPGMRTAYAFTAHDHDDGLGEMLHAGGGNSFFSPSSGQAARWDGDSWSLVGTEETFDHPIRTLASVVLREGGDSVLLAGGNFRTINSRPGVAMAQWGRGGWRPLGSDQLIAGVASIVVHDDGRGRTAWIAGGLSRTEKKVLNYVARWDGGWVSPTGQNGHGVGASPDEFELWNNGKTERLAVSGHYWFGVAGSAPGIGGAIWTGESWQSFGEAQVGRLSGAMGVYRGDLYMDLEAENQIGNLQPGERLRVLPTLTTPYNGERLEDLVAAELDGESRLFAIGDYETTVHVGWILQYDGLSWSEVGEGGPGWSSHIKTATEWDDGKNGPRLYVGGRLSLRRDGVVQSVRLASWDGEEWSAFPTPLIGDVRLLHAHTDSGGATYLYAAGDFRVGDNPVNRSLARWDGENWAFPPEAPKRIKTMTTHDDGSGPALYVGGDFEKIGDRTFNHVAEWSDWQWKPLVGVRGVGVSPNGSVKELASLNGALYVGGSFDKAGGKVAVRFAEYICSRNEH